MYNKLVPIYKKINKDFFKKWNSEMAYVLGFLFADGNIVCTKRGTWFWSLQITDKDILFKIKEIMQSEHKISLKKIIKNNKKTYRLQIGSKEMCEDLIKYGVKQRKSLDMKFPEIPKPYFSDFLRGYFDGDGGVWVGYKNKTRIKKVYSISAYFTSGSIVFLQTLQSILCKMYMSKGSLFKKKGGYDLKYSIKDSLLLYKIMYNTHSPLFLERKKGKFERYINMRP